MNKTQLLTLSGSLLASTALVGVANAATVGTVDSSVRVANANTFSTTAVKLSNTLFSATVATADALVFGGGTGGGVGRFAVDFTNNLPINTKFNATINIAGAQFVQVTPAQVNIIITGALGSYITTVSGACNVTPLQDKFLLGNCVIDTAANAASIQNITLGGGYFMGGVQLSGVAFNTGSSLATANNSISLSGSVTDQAQGVLIENITSGSIVTSTAPLTTTITAGTSAIANATLTPTAFISFIGSDPLTLALASIAVTGTGAVGTDLATIISATGLGTTQAATASLNVTVTAGALSSAAVSRVIVTSEGAPVVNVTPAAFPGGVLTFSLSAATVSYGTSTLVSVYFNGTAAIPAAAAGTVAASYSASASHAQAPAGASGATAAITQGGFSTEVNTFQSSANTGYQSFIRIHNNGTSAGTVNVTVFNDANTSGAALGAAFTTASIAVNSTLQLSAAQIETGAGITSPSGQYTVKVSGPIIGYVQHILFNQATGQVADLSSFRNQGNAVGGAP